MSVEINDEEIIIIVSEPNKRITRMTCPQRGLKGVLQAQILECQISEYGERCTAQGRQQVLDELSKRNDS